MFLILQDDTFSIKGKKRPPKRKLSGSAEDKQGSYGGHVKSISGMKFRSRNGCALCKKRKRKCDEVHPTCSYCKSRGLDCVYNQTKTSQKKQTEQTTKPAALATVPNPETVTAEGSFGAVNGGNIPVTDVPVDAFPPRHMVSTTAAGGWYNNGSFETPSSDGNFVPSPLIYQPPSLPSMVLDPQGILYFDFYIRKVSQVVSISTASMNYFTSFYNSLANNDESFLYAITSWGALYAGRDDSYKEYHNRALSASKHSFTGGSATDAYFQLVFGCVLMGYYACLADSRCLSVHEQCCDLVKKYGGLHGFAKMFHFSNEVRFMLSNIHYVDIMSTTSHKSGTKFSYEEYKQVFYESGFKDSELVYGVDTLQGTHQNIYIVFARLINLKVRVNELLKDLDEGANIETNTIAMKQCISDVFQNEISAMENEIETTGPNYKLLSLIGDDEDRDEYLHAFKMYKLTCELYLKLYIKKIPPKNFVIQDLVHQIMHEIDMLTHTKFCVIICLPLLMCGVCSTYNYDRSMVEMKIHEIIKLSPVLNNTKTWRLIAESWTLNPTGDFIVDWADICEAWGWKFNLC